jgi:hypothetical protein
VDEGGLYALVADCTNHVGFHFFYRQSRQVQ